MMTITHQNRRRGKVDFSFCPPLPPSDPTGLQPSCLLFSLLQPPHSPASPLSPVLLRSLKVHLIRNRSQKFEAGTFSIRLEQVFNIDFLLVFPLFHLQKVSCS